MSVAEAVVPVFHAFINAWQGLVAPIANFLGVEPFVIQFASGMFLAAIFPYIASNIDSLKDNIRESLSLSGLMAIFTFFIVFYQKFHGVQAETVWGQLVLEFAGSVITLLAFTGLYIFLQVDFKKWELIEKLTGKSN